MVFKILKPIDFYAIISLLENIHPASKMRLLAFARLSNQGYIKHLSSPHRR